ncbi:unnamed protein product [Linum tenue]|uniref:Uncharacterized protein n=1 Tax=Linum tenue TaxID=586396 RepID=A0AAV0HF67_9ROSI|nr:unnamed protein product [Linum tenue]
MKLPRHLQMKLAFLSWRLVRKVQPMLRRLLWQCLLTLRREWQVSQHQMLESHQSCRYVDSQLTRSLAAVRLSSHLVGDWQQHRMCRIGFLLVVALIIIHSLY